MIKKVASLFIILFVVTGCSVDYNLYINQDKVNEEIVLHNISFELEQYGVYYDIDTFSETGDILDNVEYYNMNKINNDVVLDYSFRWVNYPRSRAAKTCLKSISLKRRTDNSYILSSSAGFDCFNQFTQMDSININVTINSEQYTVSSSNADNTLGNKYIWNVTRDNESDKYIQLIFNSIQKEEEHTPSKKEEKEDSWAKDNFWLIMSGVLCLMVIVIGVAIKVNSRKR